MSGRLAAAALTLTLASALASAVGALEVDPYTAWLAEIPDSIDVLNEYTNATIYGHLLALDAANDTTADCSTVAAGVLKHFHSSVLSRRRAIAFVKKSPEVVVWKDGRGPASVWRSYYRRLPPLYVSSIAGTVDLDGIRLSLDKIGHFFGFGRRYYRRYRDALATGATRQEAERRVVLYGIEKENGLVGKKIDTIFSHADLEANWQGFRFARDLCEGPAPFLARRAGRWTLTRDVDLRAYVTPDFDEGYNNNHFTTLGWRLVRPELARYCEILELPVVQRRLRYYRTYPPSVSRSLIRDYFEARGERPQEAHSLHGLCAQQAPRSAP